MAGRQPAVLVTGAAQRIGRTLALGLAADGYFVYVHYNRSAHEAHALVAGIEAAGGRAVAIQADLAAPEQVASLIARCHASGPRLGCLIHNASLFEYDHPERFERESFERHLAVNLTAPAILSRDFFHSLQSSGLESGLDPTISGNIICLLDHKLFALNPDFYSYTVTKLALHGVVELLARAYAPRVRVNAVAPGVVLRSGAQTDEDFERSQALNPLGRGATPDDILASVRYLLTTPSLTGQVLTVDGGLHLQGLARDVVRPDDAT